MQPAADWYPDPKIPGLLRRWDGERWTDDVAPMHRQQSSSGTSVWKIITGVGVGVLAALAALWVLWSMFGPGSVSSRLDGLTIFWG